eukprot:CAMPEP_0175003826 /NCGR_PEP_ID=MMETSP0005-20121125/4436_1 /TAXON_ID=420556 /ORGANISM="Ochromonas sp., Strain CCMP1393" /LENGTH=123 /DNA_ID=CAMNT_0016258929 /DNA_START=288 /DNA_END=655 /DNA_ORIENTATION=+
MESDHYSGRLGFIADYDKNGFGTVANPSYAGDYFIPGAPLEGWVLQYVSSNHDGNVKYTKLAEGLMNKKEVSPSKIHITSSDSQQSLVWMGTTGELEVKKVVHFDINKLYFTTSVTIKNVGPG